MCGIAGWIDPLKRLGPERLNHMVSTINHRGPDATGTWMNDTGALALGHARLSIIDLAPSANQPLHDTSGGFTIILNGEIYNYQELRTDLETLGSTFQTSSDTEVLLEAYKHWGEGCLDKLNGMFAFAIWDSHKQTVFIARDRIGKKPLFYTQLTSGGIAFASEPAALLPVFDTPPRRDASAMHSFLALGYTTGENTCWRGIKRLLPGHKMRVNLDGTYVIKKYWNVLSSFENKTPHSENEAAQHLGELIQSATSLRMKSDVPYGVFLSAGIDSNAVLSAMSNTNPVQQIQTFTIGFPNTRIYDESEIAAQSAQHFETNHHMFELHNTQQSVADVLDLAAQEPLADASFIPMNELSKQTASHVKMVLGGDGGDELFAGYPTYIADALHRKLSWAVPFMPPLPAPKKRRSIYFKLSQFLNGLPLDSRRAHFSWRVLGSKNLWSALLTDEFHESFDWEKIYEPFGTYYDEAAHLSPLDQSLYVDLKTFLVDSVMVKADRATMRHGLESRAPLLDTRIVQYAASLPDSYKLKWQNRKFRGKHILRQSQKNTLPAFLFNQPKRGFSMPVSEWFAGEFHDLARSDLTSPHMAPYFKTQNLEALLTDHRNKKADHGLVILNLALLSRWLKNQ